MVTLISALSWGCIIIGLLTLKREEVHFHLAPSYHNGPHYYQQTDVGIMPVSIYSNNKFKNWGNNHKVGY